MLKERKRLSKMRRNSEISDETFLAGNAQIKKFQALMAQFKREIVPAVIPPKALVRSDRDGARQRTIFIRVLSDVLHKTTGQPHDAEVEELCQIAFNSGEDVRIDARSARRKSPA